MLSIIYNDNAAKISANNKICQRNVDIFG